MIILAFSRYLNGARPVLREIVSELGNAFSYVSVLGTDVRSLVVRANKNFSSVTEGSGECGFVVKLHNGSSFFEYSFDRLPDDVPALCRRIVESTKISPALGGLSISAEAVKDEPAKEDFERPDDFADFSDAELLQVCREISEAAIAADSRVLNATAIIAPFTVSKLFISKNRELSQSYGWANGILEAVFKGEKTVVANKYDYSDKLSDMIPRMKTLVGPLIDLAEHLTHATPIKPGVYDVITDSSISGLIAHEAFGHGVEMDQFVKQRALAQNYVGKPVASGLTNMRDGAEAAVSAASYFFDDDGVLAQNTQIIRDGVLVAGLSDLASAAQLGTLPTGNGRRESFKRKAYSRMTNTFFDAGTSTLEEMIASVDHGYMLFDTNNGMEDPKNWQIQCTAEYGIEIENGKLTDRYVSPVVMSGYVPDLLASISMVSRDLRVIGIGGCGKGYKEWVKVSDGGPNLKVKVKLG